MLYNYSGICTSYEIIIQNFIIYLNGKTISIDYNSNDKLKRCLIIYNLGKLHFTVQHSSIDIIILHTVYI